MSEKRRTENAPVMREVHEMNKAFFSLHRDKNIPFTTESMAVLRALRHAYGESDTLKPEAFTAKYESAIAMARAIMEEESK